MRRNLKLAALVAALVCRCVIAVAGDVPLWDFAPPVAAKVASAPEWSFAVDTSTIETVNAVPVAWNFTVDTSPLKPIKECSPDCPCPRKDCGDSCPCCGNPSEPDLTYADAYERAKSEHRRAIVVVGQTAKVKAEQRAIARANGWLFAAEDVVTTVAGSLPSGVHEFSPPVAVPIVQQSFAMPAIFPSYGGGCSTCSGGSCRR